MINAASNCCYIQSGLFHLCARIPLDCITFDSYFGIVWFCTRLKTLKPVPANKQSNKDYQWKPNMHHIVVCTEFLVNFTGFNKRTVLVMLDCLEHAIHVILYVPSYQVLTLKAVTGRFCAWMNDEPN